MENEKFKTGDIVWSTVYGKGQIIEIPGYTQNRETAFVAAVFYKSGKSIIYTHDGRESIDEDITLFHYEDSVPDEPVDVGSFHFEPFEEVLVYKDNSWHPAIFSHYVMDNDTVYCALIGNPTLEKSINVVPYEDYCHLYQKIYKIE